MRKVRKVTYARLHGEQLFTPHTGDLGKFLPPKLKGGDQVKSLETYIDSNGLIVLCQLDPSRARPDAPTSMAVEIRLPMSSIAQYVVGKEVEIDDPKDN